MLLSFHCYIHTPLKTFCLMEVDGHISALCSPKDLARTQQQIQGFCKKSIAFSEGNSTLLKEGERQIHEYFSGQRKTFALPIKLYGTDFQLRVWQQLQTIPYGKSRSYGEIARALGQKGAQAVGSAVGKNPLPIIVPCHRVLPADGSLGQFSMDGGTDAKAFLLQLESVVYKH